MNNNKRLTGFLVATILWCVATGVQAASITGQIQVMKKGGRHALEQFDNAIVYLTGKDQAIVTAPDQTPVIVNQKNKMFFPRLLPLVKGQTIHFYNQDELEHNVFSTEEKNSFDLGRYPKGDFRPVTYTRTGNYKVYCNIHQNMILDIVVLDNRYFALTDEQGNYRIDGVPPGKYQLHVWHVFGGMKSRDITLGNDNLNLGAMTVVSTKVVRDIEKHTDKHGKNYKKKTGRYRR